MEVFYFILFFAVVCGCGRFDWWLAAVMVDGCGGCAMGGCGCGGGMWIFFFFFSAIVCGCGGSG